MSRSRLPKGHRGEERFERAVQCSIGASVCCCAVRSVACGWRGTPCARCGRSVSCSTLSAFMQTYAPTQSLGRRPSRAARIIERWTHAPAIARTMCSGAHEPYLYRFRRQAQRHPSLAHEVCLASTIDCCLTTYRIRSRDDVCLPPG